jgi:hypothetical protein
MSGLAEPAHAGYDLATLMQATLPTPTIQTKPLTNDKLSFLVLPDY